MVSSDLLLGTSISYPSLNGIGKHISSPLDKQIYSVQKWANKHAKKLDEYAEILKNDAAWIYKDFDYVLKHGLLEDFGTSVALLMQYMNVMNYLYTIFQKEFQQG